MCLYSLNGRSHSPGRYKQIQAATRHNTGHNPKRESRILNGWVSVARTAILGCPFGDGLAEQYLRLEVRLEIQPPHKSFAESPAAAPPSLPKIAARLARMTRQNEGQVLLGLFYLHFV
jgi:hypothetical protein